MAFTHHIPTAKRHYAVKEDASTSDTVYGVYVPTVANTYNINDEQSFTDDRLGSTLITP